MCNVSNIHTQKEFLVIHYQIKYHCLINISWLSLKLKIVLQVSGYDSPIDVFKFKELFNTNKI